MLRQRISSGRYGIGERLPSERLLTQELNVHRRVVRAAIAHLEREGLVARRPHCSPVVRGVPSGAAPDDASAAPQFPASRLVALIMYHGGALEQSASAQQRIFWGMNQVLGQEGYHGVFLDLGKQVGTTDQNAASEAAHLRYVMDNNFGGAVFYAYAYDRNRDLIRELTRRMPLVLIDRMPAGIDADYVGVRNHEATYQATQFAIGQGHRRVAYVTTTESINPVQDRLQGYLHALRDAPGAGDGEMVLTVPSAGAAWPVFEAVFGLPPDRRPTALVCVNDYDAVRAARHLEALRLEVPRDVSLIGCDDIVQSLPSGVGLTTTAQPFERIGREAARQFLRRARGEAGPPVSTELASRLVVRGSVAAL